MADARDILGLPKAAGASKDILGGSGEKKSKASKEAVKKPDGVPREVYMLTGGLPPAMPTMDLASLRKRQTPSSKKVGWRWHPFTSSARSDNLQLHHWVRLVDAAPPTGDYAFAKYNKAVEVVRYTDEEYTRFLTDPKWSRQETDQLFDLCEQFDLRFIVIADRFPWDRTVEELKDRYYTAAKAVVLARAPSAEDVADHTLVKDSYDMAQEVERKRALGIMMSQTRQQELEDAKVLAEAKRIMASRAKVLEEAEPPVGVSMATEPAAVPSVGAGPSAGPVAGPGPGPVAGPGPGAGAGAGAGAASAGAAAGPSLAPDKQQHPQQTAASPPPAASAAGSYVQASAPTEVAIPQVSAVPGTDPSPGVTPVSSSGPRLPRLFLRTALLAQQVHSTTAATGVRTAKRVEQTLEELGVRPKPKVATAAVCEQHLELRKEILTLLNLQKQVQWKESEVAVLRDNPYAEIPSTPTTPKRSHRGGGEYERVATRATAMGADSNPPPGERLGKREHKRKAPARFAEAPASPPTQKRARKMKAAEL